MKGPVIEIENLRVSRNDRPVVFDLSVQVAAGEVYSLLGGNGAGKSTTLLTCIGVLKPTQGRVTICGNSVAEAPEAVRKSVAYLSESARLYDHLSARENLRYFLDLAGNHVADGAIDVALDTVLLPKDDRERSTDGFSKGMRQKVAIALALLRETPVLLLDEPTSGLDPVAVEEFHELLKTLCARGVAILMVTHDLFGACEVSSKIGLLKEGRLVEQFEAARDPEGRAIPIDLAAVKQAFAGRGQV
jgi:ABC-2 type transport system ATP-binding protein